MGKKDTTEIIIQTAQAIDLLGELLGWIGVLAAPTPNKGIKGKGGEPNGIDKATAGEGTFMALDSDCNSKAREHFLEQFSYSYNGEFTTSENFFNVQSNNVGAIGTAVGASIQGTVAPWAQADMINNITSRVSVLASGPATNAFDQIAFTLTYVDTAGSGNTFQVDISWVYCSTSAPDPNAPSNMVNTLFLSSIGIGYEAEAWSKRLLDPANIPVVRLAFSFVTVALGTAIAAFIYTARNRPTEIIVSVECGVASGTIAVTTRGRPNLSVETGNPEIEYQWALDALEAAGVMGTSVTYGTATMREATELGYLNKWIAQ